MIETVDGQHVTTPFGGQPNNIHRPVGLRLPWDNKSIRFQFSGDADQVELWNGGWRQQVNLSLRPGEHIGARVTIDLAALGNTAEEVRVERVPARPAPWREAVIAPRRRQGRLLRLVQSTPSIRAYGEPPARTPREEKDKFMAEVSRHFDVVEVFVAWTNWWYARWDEDPSRRKHATAVAREVQEWVDAAHRHGVMAALSLSWAAPGCSMWETALVPEFQGKYLDPDTGRFINDRRFFDWANDEAVEFAYRAWRDVAALMRDVDFLFFNEPTWRPQPWHRFPMFSSHALRSWQQSTGRENALLPAKSWCKPTHRTNNLATAEEWQQWQDWLSSLYAKMIRTQARAVADANKDNPRYRGAIWFQNKEWIGPKWACELDKVFAIPEISYVVCEYCTDAKSDIWRQFKYYCHKYNKRLGSFVNFGWYDPQAPGRVRYQGTIEGFAAAVRMGLDEGVDLVAAYPVASVLPWSGGYNEDRTRVWDDLTRWAAGAVRRH